jgi:multiple antibiotic resistance protein
MSSIEAIIILFAIVDPIGNIPIFLDVTEHLGAKDSKKAFNAAVLVGFIVLVTFAIAGAHILRGVFRIEVEDVTIAGGLLLVIIAIDNLFSGKLNRMSSLSSETGPYEIGSVPLGVPLLAGPGAMVTALTVLEQTGSYFVTIGSITIVFFITWLMLKFLEPLHKLMGRLASQVFSKIMSLFIAAIGVHMMLNGITLFIRSLK